MYKLKNDKYGLNIRLSDKEYRVLKRGGCPFPCVGVDCKKCKAGKAATRLLELNKVSGRALSCIRSMAIIADIPYVSHSEFAKCFKKENKGGKRNA